jgi:DNA-binding LacI/PurR family transcriptional regulator
VRGSKTDGVASVLSDRIGEGVYPAGAVLPSERELTEEFGVSRVTVRNAIERLEARNLVSRAAGRGTYVVDQAAPSRPTPAAVGSIALVSSQLTPSVASPVAAGCSSAALAHRCQLLLCDTGGATYAEAQAKELLHLKALYEQGVAGVAIWWQEGEASIPWLDRMVREGRAVVVVDRQVEGVAADFAGIDDEGAAHTAVSHLIRLGHRRIACIVHSLKVTTSSERLAGYRRALAEHGLDACADLALAVDEGRAGVGEEVARKLLSLSEPPTALLAVNDYVAVEIIEALESRGVRVPDDVATVSFADMEVARHFRVPLTTVHQPFRAIGESAVHLICERLETGRTQPKRVILPTSLIIRRSCGAHRAS